MHLDSYHLHLIKTVIDEGSAIKASEKLFVSQSAVSHQIREIELRLNLKLFDRIGKRLIPTETGRLLVDTANQVLPAMSELKKKIKNLQDGSNTRLRISTECYTCYHWLPALIEKFHQNKSSILIDIVAQATRKPIEFLQRGELDLAIVSNKKRIPNLHYVPLFEDEMVAVVSVKNPLSKLKRASSHDLVDEHVLVYHNDTESFALHDFFGEHKLIPARVSEFPLTEAIIEMVRANLGVAFLAKWAIEPHVTSKELKLISLRTTKSKRRWYISYVGELTKSKELFIHSLKQTLGNKVSRKF